MTRPGRADPLAQARARSAYALFSVLTVVSDLVPAHWRYGHVRSLTRRLLSTGALATVTPARAEPTGADEADPSGWPVASGEPPVRCVLATGVLDVGGVESVVGLLAEDLPFAGVLVDVLCTAGGRTADALRAAGVHVVEAPEPSEVLTALVDLAPDVVQLHNAPAHVAEIARGLGLPVVPVAHNTEIHRSVADWQVAARQSDQASTTIAVSDVVRRHHLAHLTGPVAPDVTVIPNGATPRSITDLPTRSDARRRLAADLGLDGWADADHPFVLVCLARYDAQKNIPGLVAGFLAAASTGADLRLVVAGAPVDWLEYRRAEALRRTHPLGHRVHLIGNSDAATLLAGSDAFILDSFFEGWPMSATEAVAVGLPLIMADVGGAAELVGADGARGVLVPNAAGAPERVDERAVRAARRRARRQANTAPLRAAILTVHDARTSWSVRRAALAAQGRREFGHTAMVARHAAVLRQAATGPAVALPASRS